MSSISYQSWFKTTIGAVEVGVGAGRGAGFIRPILAVAVVIVDVDKGDGVAAVEALEVSSGVVEGGKVGSDSSRPHCFSRQTLL